MEETIWDVSAVKDWLIEYREKERDIDNQIERLERFTIKMTSVGAQVISGMPRASGTPGDRIGSMVGQKEELENAIRSDVRKQSDKRKVIESILAQLRRSDERAVIRMRYIDRESRQARPDYAEVCRRFLADQTDFPRSSWTGSPACAPSTPTGRRRTAWRSSWPSIRRRSNPLPAGA